MHRLSLAVSLALLSLSSAGAVRAQSVAASTPAPSPATTAPQQPGALRLDRLLVVADKLFPYQEGITLDADHIKAQPRGNADVGALLRIHPSVQFHYLAVTSRNAGEIRPSDISINGGLYYQNSFLVDGVSFNNDIDPAAERNVYSFTTVPSQTQGIALDSGLLGALTVYDSNVPAAFGGFNGGVVDAKTRRAGDTLSGSVAIRHTRSSWTKRKLDPLDAEDGKHSTSADLQPEFDKREIRATLEGRTRSGIGLLGSVSQLDATIPLQAYNTGLESSEDSNRKEQSRRNTSVFLRADWESEAGLALDAFVLHAPTRERYFQTRVRDSYFTLDQGGSVAGLHAQWPAGNHLLDGTLSYSDLDSSRRSDADSSRNWDWSPEKNWGHPDDMFGSSEGSYGDLDQRQRDIKLALTAERDAFVWLGAQHHLSYGAELALRTADYRRPRQHNDYQMFSTSPTDTCTDATGKVDDEACSLSPTLLYDMGQYINMRSIYLAGGARVRERRHALFVQDDMRWGRLSLRAGLRLDGDDYMDQTTVAPRLALGWDVRGDGSLRLTAGANRYYGRNFFGYRLAEAENALEQVQERGDDLVWQDYMRSRSMNHFAQLDVPYSDELLLGVDKRLGGFDVGLKYVQREGHDEVVRHTIDRPDDADPEQYRNSVYRYANDGRSGSRTWTLAITPVQPWRLGRSETTFLLAADHTDVRRSYSDYNDPFWQDRDDVRMDELIRYDGRLMRRRDQPADNYNRPWTVRLSTRTAIDALGGLEWGNFLRYRAGYQAVTLEGTELLQGERVEVYEKHPLAATWSWDTSVQWNVLDGAYVRVEVQNVLDRANLIRRSRGRSIYETGRQFWVELGYRFQ